MFALEFTAPAWTLLLAVPVLGERMTTSRIGAVVLGLIGVLVILRPGTATFQPAALLVLAAAIGFAATLITTKQLTMTDSTFAIIFWMNVIQFPLTMIGSDPLFVMKVTAEPDSGLPRGRRSPGWHPTTVWPMHSGPATRAWSCRSIFSASR